MSYSKSIINQFWKPCPECEHGFSFGDPANSQDACCTVCGNRRRVFDSEAFSAYLESIEQYEMEQFYFDAQLRGM